MKQPEWRRIEEVFGIAVALRGADERAAYLDRIRRDDVLLASEIESLLSADELADILPHSFAGDTLDADLIETPLIDAATPLNKTKEMPHALIGQVVGGRYLIERKLGEGGMGIVFLARDQNVMNRETVVKMLLDQALKNKIVVQKFKQEIEALARIKDEGIVTILDSGVHDEQLFLVLEFVEGEDLGKIVSPLCFSARDFLAPEKTAAILRAQNTEAVKHLWSRLNAPTRNALLENDSAIDLPAILRDEFNDLLADWNLYDETKFQTIALSPLTIKFRDGRAESGKTISFNRLLLGDVFPDHFVNPNSKKLKTAETAEIFRQLGISLAHGHRKGVYHRDLKPANIMLTETAERGLRVKLIDFGVARVRESLVAPTTEVAMMVGTQCYMSPEQLQGNRDLTAACDIYALGLIAFEMLTGKRMFAKVTAITQFEFQRKHEFPELEEMRGTIPEAAEKVIRKALEFEPENRYQNAAEFGNALNKALLESEPETPTVVTKTEGSPVDKETKNVSGDGEKNNFAKILLPIVAILLLGAISVGVWRMFAARSGNNNLNSNQNLAATAEFVPQRELNYKLIVQQYIAGKPVKEPFEATGDQIFVDGWRFKLRAQSPQNGNLYLLTEGERESGAKNLAMLFPHPEINAGKSSVAANQSIETGEMEFDKKADAEKFWIVWTKAPIAELEAVTGYVNPRDLGLIKDAAKETAVRDFLAKHGGKENLRESNEKSQTGEQKKVQSSTEILIKVAEFRHQ